MTLRTIELRDLDNVEYYILVMWKDKTKMGETYKNIFFNKVSAKNRLRVLAKTGEYEQLIIRKESVTCRRENLEISNSSVYYKWAA